MYWIAIVIIKRYIMMKLIQLITWLVPINMSASVDVIWLHANLYIWNIQAVNWRHLEFRVSSWMSYEARRSRNEVNYSIGGDNVWLPSLNNKQGALNKVKIQIP